MQEIAYGVFLATFNGTQLQNNVFLAVQPLLLSNASMQAKNLEIPRHSIYMVPVILKLLGKRLMYILEKRGEYYRIPLGRALNLISKMQLRVTFILT